MNNQTPDQFITTLYSLADGAVHETPEFVFMVAVRDQLLKNHFGRDEAHRLASQQNIRLPFGATAEQLEDMGYHYANLLAKCHDDLETKGGFEGPNTEASLLAQRLVREALA